MLVGNHVVIPIVEVLFMSDLFLEYTDFSVNKIGEVQFPGEVVVSAHHDTIALEDEDKFTLVLEDFSEQQSLDIYVVSIDMLTIVIQDLTSKSYAIII